MVRYLAIAFIFILRAEAAQALPLDSGGWSVVTESPDTRKVHVSSSTGDDANDGLTEATPVKTLAKGYSLLRDGFPDWLLLKKGDVWTDESFPSWDKSGRSEQERMLLGTHGTGARPLVQAASGVYGWATIEGPSHIAIIGIHFYAYTRDPNNPGYVSSAAGGGISYRDAVGNSSANLLIEDVKIEMSDGCTVNDRNPEVGLTNLEVRRSVFVDSYADPGNHSSGIFVHGVDGILFEENVFDHNGWFGDRDTGGAAGPDGAATKFNHNVYVDNSNPYNTPKGEPTLPPDQTDNIFFRGNISTRASSHGIMLRPGGTMEDNLFARNPLQLIGGGDDPLVHAPGGVDGIVRNNVMLEGNDIDSSTVRGTALQIRTSRNMLIEGNLSAHDISASKTNTKGFHLAGDGPNPAVSFQSNTFYRWLQGAIKGADGSEIVSEENNIYWDAGSIPWPVTGTNRDGEELTFIDPTRAMASYNASLGGTGSFEAFMAEARSQSKDNWRAAYTAVAVNDWIRAGYVEANPDDPPPPDDDPPPPDDDPPPADEVPPELLEQREFLIGEITRVEDEIAVVQEEILALELEIAILKEDIAELEAKVAKFEELLKDGHQLLEGLKADLAALEAELIALEAELAALKEQLAALEAELAALQAELAAVEQEIASYE